MRAREPGASIKGTKKIKEKNMKKKITEIGVVYCIVLTHFNRFVAENRIQNKIELLKPLWSGF